jgi:hypothetical protein
LNAACRISIEVLAGLASIAALATVPSAAAQTNLVRIDATAPAPTPQPVEAQLGSNRSPRGETIAVNSQYLTLDGKPWLPVMGEFHYSRYPADRWEEEILKMKAAGVQIVSAYVIWLHHEQAQGQFDWSGQRDLRRFVELCAKHGMYVYPRIGPWAHAEVRHGGLPDWVMAMGPTRENDPQYLAAVNKFYQQIGTQLKGEMWKDGGPVIGIQIENEYRASGKGKGVEHIRTLKQMALKAGFDVPLYTVTGWDGAAIPLDQALPVFGGYPDAPWDGTPHKLPPNEVYAFRFDNRSSGSMGAIGGHGQSNASTYSGTPFLTAEVGDGIEDTYFRRPVVTADDVAAIVPVMLGSGVNLLGYYMFHGGRNPDAQGITLQESQRTGYPTDVPVKSYDFQAPLGEFGQERASLPKLKLVHYFLADFGSELAPMPPRRPAALPDNPSDLSVPRISARTLGDRGFIFFNNHVRGAEMPGLKAFQVELKLPGGTVRIPEQPFALRSDAYGIWPVNLPIGAQTLRWSTSQLFKRIAINGKTFYFFFAIDGLPAQFAFDKATHLSTLPAGFQQSSAASDTVVTAAKDAFGSFALDDGTTLVLLSESQAEQVWRGDDEGTLLSTGGIAYADHSTWTLESLGDPNFRFGLFGAQTAASQTTHAEPPAPGEPSVFTWFRSAVAPFTPQIQVQRITPAGERPPLELGPSLPWRKTQIPFAPEDKDFSTAAGWSIKVPALPGSASGVADLFLRIRYRGDVARLYRCTQLLDDSFWNGLPWEVGLRETLSVWPTPAQDFNLRILPLPAGAPMYLEARARTDANAVPATLDSVTLVPEYRVDVLTTPRK